MREISLIFLGGGLGSVSRFFIGKFIATINTQQFPYGTLVANIIACFVLGLVVGLADHRQLISASAKLFWAVGFCGGFSTFSTFSLETLNLIQNGLTLSAILYIIMSLALCLVATYAGMYVGQNN